MGCSLNLYSILRVHLTQWCPSTQNTSWFRESQNTTDPRLYARVVYIADDALRHQPMGSRSHDCSSSAGLLDSYPALLLYLAGDALHQQPMGSRSHDCSSYVGCGEFRVLHWCRPMLACIGGNKLWHPDDHLIWCPKVDSGPHISLPFLVDLPL